MLKIDHLNNGRRICSRDIHLLARLNLSNDHMSKQNLVKSFPFRDKGKSDLCTISAKKRKNQQIGTDTSSTKLDHVKVRCKEEKLLKKFSQGLNVIVSIWIIENETFEKQSDQKRSILIYVHLRCDIRTKQSSCFEKSCYIMYRTYDKLICVVSYR